MLELQNYSWIKDGNNLRNQTKFWRNGHKIIYMNHKQRSEIEGMLVSSKKITLQCYNGLWVESSKSIREIGISGSVTSKPQEEHQETDS
ncbi:hypothetical protein EVAR_71380_1 [Eumeta japonica]|uniref:Uncharacterized protein n=1 Tax=Eumeta variegata TaxID=151549 RepID=A0A4C1SA95_EUMVA|nr:hypothetical protein EVAR_71380_1 [Eumeta japonica]